MARVCHATAKVEAQDPAMSKEASKKHERPADARESRTRMKTAPASRRGATPSEPSDEPLRRSARARNPLGDEAA